MGGLSILFANISLVPENCTWHIIGNQVFVDQVPDDCRKTFFWVVLIAYILSLRDFFFLILQN